MRVIFIGAGRGSRLMPTTENEPKCFARIQDKRILDWNLEAFAQNEIYDICFIGGYLIERVREAYPQFTFRQNHDWENNNILASLMYAEDLMNVPFICCYSDTLYSANLIAGLAASEHDITLSVDTGWRARYENRTEHPAGDAEKVTSENGVVTRVHREIDLASAWGEYTGVAKFSVAGAEHLKHHHARCRAEFAGKPFREAAVFEKAYLIHLLQDMIEQGVEMQHADTANEYIEIDTQQDFEYAQINWEIPS
ncbi:MAG: phosphocholine cytidylyltransferase family protein [Akkermansiaceae bacterium]